MSYAQQPQPEAFDAVMERVVSLRLHQLPEHRHGIAGALHGILFMHPDLENTWKREWNQPLATLEACRPPESDQDISKPPEVDYLWMYGVTCQDDLSVERIARLSRRADPVGSAAYHVVQCYAHHPMMRAALVRAVSTLTTQPHDCTDAPHASVRSLALRAEQVPPDQGAVLYVGWLPPLPGSVGSLVICTPDGQAPVGFPATWDGYPVSAQKASPTDVSQWSKVRADMHRP
jgi:hypothetical protein